MTIRNDLACFDKLAKQAGSNTAVTEFMLTVGTTNPHAVHTHLLISFLSLRINWVSSCLKLIPSFIMSYLRAAVVQEVEVQA